MKLIALGVEENPTNVIDYGGLLQVIDPATGKGIEAAAVQVINGMIGCYEVAPGGSLVEAAPHFPPPPPLPHVRIVMSAALQLDAAGSFLVANQVGIPMLSWPTKTAPTTLKELLKAMTPVQANSGLASVIYHLFNVTDPNAGAFAQKTIAIPVDPAKAFLLTKPKAIAP